MSGDAQATAPIRRQDYQAAPFFIDTVDLTFDLDPAKTRVLNKMRVRRNPDVPLQALRLDGEELNLSRVLVNGQGTSFKMDGDRLVLEQLPEGHEPFELEFSPPATPPKTASSWGCMSATARSSRSARPKAFVASPTSWTAPM